MTVKSLLIFLLVFVAGVSFWLFRVDKGLKNARDIIVEQRTAPPRKTVTVVAPSPDAVSKEAMRAQLQTESQNLANQLEVEKRKLAVQKESLNKLRQPASEPETNNPVNYTTAIRSNRDEIADFLTELRGYDQIEAYINRRAQEALQDQANRARVAREQLDDNIKVQQELMAQTQEQITALQDYRNYVDGRDAKMEELQGLLQSQQALLEAMRAQRVDIASEIQDNSRAVQSEKDQALSSLNENKNALNQQIQSLRAEIARMQDEQNTARMSSMSRTSLLSQYERNLDQQNRKVEVLQQNLKTKEDQLNLLR
jgi:chromosome segregation ATPase